MKSGNTVFGLLLCLLVIAVQACTTTPKYQHTVDGSSLHEPQAVFSRAPGERLGEAKRVQVVSVNGINVDTLSGDEIRTPVGKNHVKYLVEWSNEFVQEGVIAFEAKANTTYRLSAYEVKASEREYRTTYTPSDPDSLGDSLPEGLGMGLFYAAILPWLVITSPIWVPIGLATEGDKYKLPYIDCCFVWIEEKDGEASSGNKPKKLVEYEHYLRQAVEGDPESQYLVHQLDPSPESIIWLCRAADQRYSKAQFEIGKLYYYGSRSYLGFESVSQDIAKACMWFQLADQVQINTHDKLPQTVRPIEVNETEEMKRTANTMSADQLAFAIQQIRLWQPGQCEEDVIKEAGSVQAEQNGLMTLCNKADLGDASARNELGRLYYFGFKGLPENPPRSYMWYHLASEVTISPYTLKRQSACDEMTSEQRSHAIRLLQEWAPGKCEKELLQNED